MAQRATDVPLGGFMNTEIYPLADFNEVMKATIESLKRAEQTFPGPTATR